MITMAVFLAILLAVLIVASELSIPVFLVFLVLKLVGVIAWEWLWVCFPLIICAGTFVLGTLLDAWTDIC